MTILRPELVAPGYLFLAPYRNLAPGIYIYDNHGELVWASAGAGGPRTSHVPHLCQYKGKDHLCYYQGDQHHGYARGFGVVMDNTYRIVKTIESSGAGASSDMHEFRLTPYSNGKTALVTVYQPRPYDFLINPRFNMEGGMGWIIDGVFQEIDVDSGEVVFEWRSLDHVDPSLSWVMPATTDTSGHGLDTLAAWDYFHINSIDKNGAGDYLISARHASAIYKISGVDGHIIWQLGGTESTIELADFSFGYQHEARWRSENATHTVLTFFDNSGNGFNHTSEFSRGLVIAIEHVSNTARVVKEWNAPEPAGGLKSASQGNMQLLPNGGSVICWGEHAYFSEHIEDGSTVMYGKLAMRESNVMMYRAHKFNWTAQPTTKPTLWTFSKSGDAASGTRAFISWNGATEVRSWAFFSGPSASGPWAHAGTSTKHGFETEFVLDLYSDWTYAEALDEQGRVLSSSGIQRTFVPSPALAVFCDERGCRYNSKVAENDTTPFDSEAVTEQQYLSTNRGYDTRKYYMGSDSAASSIAKVMRGTPSMPVVLITVFILIAGSAVGFLCLRPGSPSLTSMFDWTYIAVGWLMSLLQSSNWQLSTKSQEKDEMELLCSSSEAS